MSDRLPNGQFAPGNKSGGRAPRVVEVRRVNELSKIVTEEKWRQLCEVALNDAIHGEDYQTRDRGRRFIAEYLIGKPRQTIEVAKAPEDFEQYEDISDEELIALASGEEATKRYQIAKRAADAIIEASNAGAGS